jgi:hypothetical protein
MPSSPDVVVCLANRRWTRNYDRSQVLMNVAARERTVVYVEEPELDATGPDVELAETRTGVTTLIAHLPPTLTPGAIQRAQHRAIHFVLAHLGCHSPVLWYYAPQTLSFTEDITARAIVYDWIDADTQPGRHHQMLLDRADVVFTDGAPDHRRLVHHNVHAFSGEPTWEYTWRSMWTHVEDAIEQRSQLLVTQPLTSHSL